MVDAPGTKTVLNKLNHSRILRIEFLACQLIDDGSNPSPCSMRGLSNGKMVSIKFNA